MQFTFLGHACCTLTLADKTLLIDPYISENPQCTVDVEAVKCDAIVLTHAHADHYGDVEPIAKANDAPVIATFELAQFCESKGLKVEPMHIGGTLNLPFATVSLTPAWHGSSHKDPATGIITQLGHAVGVVVEAQGSCFYHAGDTGFFSDLGRIGKKYAVDLMCVPIGDRFTMGIEDALEAVALVKPACVVPIHYNTWEPIEQDGVAFVKVAQAAGIEAREMGCGDSIDLKTLTRPL